MASDVQIAKLALQHIGDRWDITALDDASPEAEQVNLIFEDTRDALLRAHPWDPEFVYTQAITDPNEFDPQFVLAFSYMLASRLAIPLTGDGSIAQAMLQQALISVGAAEETDSNEGIEPDKPEASWITARL